MKGQITRGFAAESRWSANSHGGGIAQEPEQGLNLGQRVRHPTFGEGVVLNAEGSGHNARVQINFDGVGGKWLVMAYARLEVI